MSGQRKFVGATKRKVLHERTCGSYKANVNIKGVTTKGEDNKKWIIYSVPLSIKRDRSPFLTYFEDI
ncbi:hypothetical protein LguiA_023166 [Lonicera macranthoides]